MAKTSAEPKTMVFHRLVKALRGHMFAGLYAVEKVYLKENKIYKAEIVHEWDLRAFSEAALAKLGGSAAFDAYNEDHDVVDLTSDKPAIQAAKPRDVVKEADVKNDMKLKDE